MGLRKLRYVTSIQLPKEANKNGYKKTVVAYSQRYCKDMLCSI